jgi:hypothetical protein
VSGFQPQIWQLPAGWRIMTTTLEASNLVLKDVRKLLKLERKLNNSFSPLLSLEPLTANEQQDLNRICLNLESYYEAGKLLEEEVKFLALSPLMWLAGFYDPKIGITLEENIAPIHIQDEDIVIKGRMDILAVTRPETNTTPLWILLIESKRGRIDALEGLPQLLTYAHTSLAYQDSVWGLTTNGINYQFILLVKQQSTIYYLLPELSIIRPEQSRELLQVLKEICKQY